MLNDIIDVLFFDPDEDHAIFHNIVWDDQFLEILYGKSSFCSCLCSSFSCFIITRIIFSFVDAHWRNLEIVIKFCRIKFGGNCSLSFLWLNIFTFLCSFLPFVISQIITNFTLLPFRIDVDGFNLLNFDVFILMNSFGIIELTNFVLPIEMFNPTNLYYLRV